MKNNTDKDMLPITFSKNDKHKSTAYFEEDMGELIKNAQNGDKLSFEEILKRLKGFIYSKCLKTYISGYDTEDLVSECNKEVISAVYKYDVNRSNGAALSYLTTSIVNCLKMLIRKNASRPAVISLNQKTEEDGNTEIVDLIFAEEDVEATVIFNIDKDIIMQLIEKLPERQRELIEGVYFKNLKISEYGELSGINPKALSKIKSRAIANLRKYYNELYKY